MKKILLNLSLITLFVSCQGESPKDIGVSIQKFGKLKRFALKPCPPKPNCISSYQGVSSEGNYLEPFKIHTKKDFAYEKIIKIVLNDKSARILKQSNNYIQAEFTSKLFKFVDDVEFFFGDNGVVHFRSASRLGYYDFSANKRRIEKIRFKFHQNSF